MLCVSNKMKDITDYFSSPTKRIDTKGLEGTALEFVEGKLESGQENGKILGTIENSTTDKLKPRSKKGRKSKKAKRKPSDPGVKNITDLFSSSFSLISPNTSCNAVRELVEESKDSVKEFVTSDKKSDCIEVTCTAEDVSCTVVDVAEAHDETSQLSVNGDEKSPAKRNAFQFMMERRNKSIGQNSPGRVLAEDEAKTEDDELLKKKLVARRSLLQNWSEKRGASKRQREEEKDEIISHKLSKRAKRLKRLLHVEDVKDDFDVPVTSKKKKRIRNVSTSSESSKDVAEAVENTVPVLEIIDEVAQDRVLHQAKPKETKQVLLNFFGVVNSTKKTDDVIEEKCATKVRGHRSKSKTRKSKRILEQDVAEEIAEQRKSKKYSDDSSQGSSVLKTPKNKLLSENEDSLTPRSLRSWKMRIKINLGEDADDSKSPEKQKSNSKELKIGRDVSGAYAELTSDENSNEGKYRSRRRKQGEVPDNAIVLSSGSEDDSTQSKSKPLKIAPVFVKPTPKPKMNPQALEARKQFLMSGIPSSLRKAVEKQQSVDEREFEIFPVISHVQQKDDAPFWSLSKPQINVQEHLPVQVAKLHVCTGLTNSHVNTRLDIQVVAEKVDKLKTLLNRIKTDNPNYPVYKSFRLIYVKSGLTSERSVEKNNCNKRGRRSKNLEAEAKPESVEFAMWTDKYKPNCSDDIVGNNEAVKTLKKWLETWMNFSDEINATKRRRRDESASESDFDSNESLKLPGNTVVLGGPCGSGKSTAVYAICRELGFSVIELNASSKRTGKRLLQELQEATQSHQVRKKQQNLFASNNTKTEPTEKKMCVLLIEDLDIVFEQDDGFISALTQLIATTKRPIVMTTTDTTSAFVQKFLCQYEYIPFLPLSQQSLATWLQVLCLIEGRFVDQSSIGTLLEFNQGDVRRTLLQLQFWVQSGGQIVRQNLPIRVEDTRGAKEKISDDELPPPFVADKCKSGEVFVHSNCIGAFTVFRNHKLFSIPYYLNLGLLWWNMPNMLRLPNFSKARISNDADVSTCKPNKLSQTDRTKLVSVAKLYDSLAFTDVAFRTIRYFDGIEPTVTNYCTEVRDSLELRECMDNYDGYSDFVHDVTHTLVNGCVEEYQRIDVGECALNLAAPDRVERRWRAKQHVCEDVFQEALSLSSYVERRSVALDYMPSLRNVARSESNRAANNTKRGNRFRNCLRNFGIKYNDSTLKLACNMFAVRDDL